MADEHAENDRDSAFGGDDLFWSLTDSMFSSLQPLAGTKRAADSVDDDAQIQIQSTQPGKPGESSQQYSAGLIDPRALCCTNCPEICPEAYNRPSKRCASAVKVGEYHNLPAVEAHSSMDECQFPDDCFEKFCQDCNLEGSESCTPKCASPCSGPDCPEDNTCFDPHCAQKSPECTDGCTDPECTKLACPDQPCFCQKCDAQPCPLGDPSNECHFAHSAPTPVGTIYCYDNAPCHFQEGHHGHDNGLIAFETYPCFSENHGFTIADHLTTSASTAPTPVLSHSNYTSLESAFASEASPAPTQGNFSNCHLNISTEHCHIDNSCCHGPKRACGEFPSAPQQDLDFWNNSIAEGNGLANNFMNFGFSGSDPMSPLSATPRGSMSSSNPLNIDSSMLHYGGQPWMLSNMSFPDAFGPSHGNATKLDFLVNAAQTNMLASGSVATNTESSTQETGTPESPSHICKW